MRGDPLSRQWRVLRQIEASKCHAIADEIATLYAISRKTGCRDLYLQFTAEIVFKIQYIAVYQHG